MIERLEDPGPAMEGSVADALRQTVKEQFDSQGAQLATPWVPPAARDWPEGVKEALFGTGDLVRSLASKGAPYGSQELRDGGKTLAVSTEAPGAVEAQSGTPHEPARPIWPDDVPDDVAEAILDKLGDYIVDGLLNG